MSDDGTETKAPIPPPEPEIEPSIKKRRGRPRKKPAVVAAEAPAAAIADDASPIEEKPSTEPPRKRQRRGRPPLKLAPPTATFATWDDAASKLLLHLRFDELRALFTPTRSRKERGAAWVQLAATLSERMGRPFNSIQCQGKLNLLKKKWEDQVVDNDKSGSDSPQETAESAPSVTVANGGIQRHGAAAGTRRASPSERIKSRKSRIQPTMSSTRAESNQTAENGDEPSAANPVAQAIDSGLKAVAAALTAVGAEWGRTIQTPGATTQQTDALIQLIRQQHEESKQQNAAILTVLNALLHKLNE